MLGDVVEPSVVVPDLEAHGLYVELRRRPGHE